MALNRPARGAVLLDKDGTLLRNVPYNVDPHHMQLADTAGDALRILGATGRPLVVVSNQPGVALGGFQESALQAVHRRLAELFRLHGARLSGFFYCPHHPDGAVAQYAVPCSCRKPSPGMLQAASSVLGFDLRTSWMIGDILDDIEAGRRVGCNTILVDCGGETEWVTGAWRTPDFIVPTLGQAAQIVAGEPVAACAPFVAGQA
ncbi:MULTISPECIES: D-glycero-alpha-D-manno-heptose-1,7-bisphosphate 7-phosphatase [Cupriavidus]|uniref:D,D-heptose 1,7-bisphosphate phosphatase n=1 Tax=Cupriavidus pinatubonensis (strain JMP 134 / LMG 1197) TaxID=264198 RepID=Q46SZ5_CUPPJ|nr:MULTISPECIES: HAD family hydrolase [Cupriavidus]TPQ29553.1 HAD family hydrolase [Cupriavidus pinatubonensis]